MLLLMLYFISLATFLNYFEIMICLIMNVCMLYWSGDVAQWVVSFFFFCHTVTKLTVFFHRHIYNNDEYIEFHNQSIRFGKTP
jgi:hypothetical protein